jgi:multiple sugar transport system ATP-binding protein
MRDGVVQQYGTPREFYQNPTNTYVARFIGTPPTNLIHATAGNGALRVGQTQLLASPHLAVATAGSDRPVLLGLRPNAVEPVEHGGPETLASHITLVEHVGADHPRCPARWCGNGAR